MWKVLQASFQGHPTDLVAEHLFGRLVQTGQKLRGELIEIYVRVTCENMCQWDFVLGYKIEEIQFNAAIS